MQILEVSLSVRDVDSCAGWFATVLSLPVRRDGPSAVVTVGSSRLVLSAHTESDAEFEGRHHLAFAVRPEDFEGVLAFARAELGPLAAGGSEVIDGPEGWDSLSVYFHGPEGMVLEYIAREAHRGRYPAPAPQVPSGVPHVLSLSEVGIGVASVPATVRILTAWPELRPYHHEPGPTDDFAPVGDVDGLLIVVADDRIWFPTDHDLPSRGRLAVTIAGPGGREVSLNGPTTVRSGG